MSEAKNFVDDVAQEQLEPTERFATGFSSLDFAMGGGLHDRRIVVLGGTSGAGKTTLGLNVVRNISKTTPVGIVPMEMGAKDTRLSLVAMDYGRSRDLLLSDLLSGVDEYRESALAAIDRFSHRQIKIAKIEPGTQVAVEDCFKWAKREQVRVLMIDHAQEFAGWEDRPRGGEYPPTAIMKRLWEIVRGGNPEERERNKWPPIALLLVAQLNRKADPQRPPSKEQFADTPQLERRADAVWLAHRPQRGQDGRDNVIELIIDKNRLGRETKLPIWVNFAAGLMNGMSVEETEMYFGEKKHRRGSEARP